MVTRLDTPTPCKFPHEELCKTPVSQFPHKNRVPFQWERCCRTSACDIVVTMSEIQGVPPPDTMPEQAIPIPTPKAPSIPTPPIPVPHIPSPKVLKSWLPLYIRKTDAVIAHLNRYIHLPYKEHLAGLSTNNTQLHLHRCRHRHLSLNDLLYHLHPF